MLSYQEGAMRFIQSSVRSAKHKVRGFETATQPYTVGNNAPCLQGYFVIELCTHRVIRGGDLIEKELSVFENQK